MEFKVIPAETEHAEEISELYKKVWRKYEGKIKSDFLNILYNSSKSIINQIQKGYIFCSNF